MAIFKCKMCGGALEINDNESVASCDYCGTKQTLPKLNDEKRVNLYDRANHFRRNNEYDKAMAIYEQILNEDSNDAEAYWSLVLCRYGIEYVEDPVTRKRVPTINRAQTTSIFTDNDYKAAISLADGYQKVIYEDEAKVIDGIQKNILAISQKEEPFDIFICYKETDNTGRRTPDSVLANDLYHQLTKEGFKVFFAKITLEAKLGSAYEPYIFAAIQSAKVMIVLGTKSEYFKAVWVKNEWSRFIALINKGADKILIPAYKDMDPYDLPEEFSHLQAQDMSKLGFMQDLIRGANKLVNEDKSNAKETIVVSASSNVEPLLKRAFMFLEDKDFIKAQDFSEQVLNLDPENAEAYVCKLLIELQLNNRSLLKDCLEPFDSNNNYQKAVRFGNKQLVSELSGCINHINERNENNRLTAIYNGARTIMESAKKEDEYIKAGDIFKEIDYFSNAKELSEECYLLAENTRKEVIYNEANHSVSMAKNEKKAKYILKYLEKALKEFEKIPDFKDVEDLMANCKHDISQEKIREKVERKKENKIKALIAAIVSIIIIASISLYAIEKIKIADDKYDLALTAIRMKAYSKAMLIIDEIGNYKGIRDTLSEYRYKDAEVFIDNKQFQNAREIFVELGDYKDSQERVTKTMELGNEYDYQIAVDLMGKKHFALAIEKFQKLGNYKDSAQKLKENQENERWRKIKNAKKGDIIEFGIRNGNYIDWIVLDKNKKSILVITESCLGTIEYNTTRKSITWEHSTLRKYLNNEFYNTTFSEKEKKKIPLVTLVNKRNPVYKTYGGRNTKDRVFILSIFEANKYKPKYAWNWWWTRTPGSESDMATEYLSDDTSIYYSGTDVSHTGWAVRPAMWINNTD